MNESVAVLFFGQPRFSHLQSCTGSLRKNLIDPNRALVVAHFWSTVENTSSESSWVSFHRPPLSDSSLNAAVLGLEVKRVKSEPQVDLTATVDLIRPVLLSRFPHWAAQLTKRNVFALVSQIYSLQQAWDLVVTEEETRGRRFRWVITARTDVVLRTKLTVADYAHADVIVTDQHDRFPDLVVAYRRDFAPYLSAWSRLPELAECVSSPTGEGFREAALSLATPTARVATWQTKLRIERGESFAHRALHKVSISLRTWARLVLFG